jgi:chromosome segregation ATPase
MKKETTAQGRVGKLQRLLARLNGNREELEHMEPIRARLEAMLDQIAEAADRQASYTAAKQEATQQFQSFLTEGERLATILLLGVKQNYGIRAEKLADFGLQPFRGRRRKDSPEPEPEPTAPTPAPPVTT